jgi:lysophospholipase L1-like esterase
MRAIRWALPALGLCCCSSAAPAQAAAYVLGDSLGLGVAQVSHLKNLSRISIHIRGNKMQEQIAQTPAGSTVFMTLGTNDANGSIAKLDKSIDDIVAAFEKKNITLIWMGPPCVKQSWDTRARELDAILAKRFEGTSVRYVSMRDDVMCSFTYHERDGVHLKMKGYAHMWEKAAAAAGFEVAAVTPEPEPKSKRTTASLAPKRTAGGKGKKAERVPLPVPRKPYP